MLHQLHQTAKNLCLNTNYRQTVLHNHLSLEMINETGSSVVSKESHNAACLFSQLALGHSVHHSWWSV